MIGIQTKLSKTQTASWAHGISDTKPGRKPILFCAEVAVDWSILAFVNMIS